MTAHLDEAARYTMGQFGALILGAGLSSRMGGPNKLLTPYRGAPLLSHALETISKLGLGDSLVVTGRDAGDIGDLAGKYSVRTCHHESYADGLGGSIAFGVSRLIPSVAGVFIVLGDMPNIRAADLDRASQSFQYGAIVIPVHGGKRGHPILFCASYRNALAALSGDTGGRAVISSHSDKVIEVEAGHAGVLQDFDRPEDFLR